MPGSSPTIERRCPISRLKSVDLPTLGRPTMVTSGRFIGDSLEIHYCLAAHSITGQTVILRGRSLSLLANSLNLHSRLVLLANSLTFRERCHITIAIFLQRGRAVKSIYAQPLAAFNKDNQAIRAVGRGASRASCDCESRRVHS